MGTLPRDPGIIRPAVMAVSTVIVTTGLAGQQQARFAPISGGHASKSPGLLASRCTRQPFICSWSCRAGPGSRATSPVTSGEGPLTPVHRSGPRCSGPAACYWR